MIIFLHGEELFLLGRRRRVLQEAFLRKNKDSEVFIFDFEDDRSSENVSRALAAGEEGLFSRKKTIIFLHPFSLGEKDEEKLKEFLKKKRTLSSSENVYLFVAPGKVKKTHPLTKALLKAADTEEVFEKLEGSALKTFVKKEVAATPGTRFSGGALALFLERVGEDTARISQELAKLSLYKQGESIEETDVRILVADTRAREKVVFEALDALARGKKAEAILLFREEERNADGVYGILALCAWQVRKLLVIREAFEEGRRSSDIARTAKLPPFAVERMLRSLSDFPLTRLKKGLILLSDLDVEMKQGKIEPAVALDLFVWKF